MSTDRTELKLEFAASLLRHPGETNEAAFAITTDTGLALQIARDWPRDPIVLGEMERLLNSVGAKTFLPTKEVQARSVYKMAENEKVTVDERLKAHRLYAELMGFIEKPQAGNVTNVLNQGVMVVKDHGTDQQWEDSLVKQQRTLTSNASVN